MSQPIPLTRPRPNLDPPQIRPEETPQQRRARQLAFLRELAELNMRAARAAAARIEQTDPETEQADAATLSLARATRAVTTIFNIEDRIADGEQAPPLRPHDPRRAILRDALYPLATQEPDPARRAAIRRRFDQAIDDVILTDLDDDLPLAETAMVIANRFGLHLDLATVADALLGIPPRPPMPSPAQHHRDDGAHDFPRAPPYSTSRTEWFGSSALSLCFDEHYVRSGDSTRSENALEQSAPKSPR